MKNEEKLVMLLRAIMTESACLAINIYSDGDVENLWRDFSKQGESLINKYYDLFSNQ